MLKKWVKYLYDPVDKTSLKIGKIIEKKGDDILFGTLRSKSGNMYSIEEGVPILLNRHTQSLGTVDGFAYEWEKFDFDFGKKGWLQDIVKPVFGSTKYFKNKTIVDCGAGSGRQSLWMAKAGAKFVFSVELSNGARMVVKKVISKYKDKIFVIQADVAHLPINFKNADIDLFYCINVIQHTRDPVKALKEIAKSMNKSSKLMFNIYLNQGREVFVGTVETMRFFTKFFPGSILRYFSFILALPLVFIFRFGHSFKETWLDVYDLLGSHKYQKFYSEPELKKLINFAGLKILKRTKYALLLSLK